MCQENTFSVCIFYDQEGPEASMSPFIEGINEKYARKGTIGTSTYFIDSSVHSNFPNIFVNQNFKNVLKLNLYKLEEISVAQFTQKINYVVF